MMGLELLQAVNESTTESASNVIDNAYMMNR